MLVSEIFDSIEGEGIRTGYPVTFIRLYGCNLSCTYCDSEYAWKEGEFTHMEVDEILARVAEFGHKRVTVTGGEPMVHKDIVQLLLTLLGCGYEVNVETNGSHFVGHMLLYSDLIFTVDYKSISSGMNDKMYVDNIPKLRPQDVLKFVVGSIEDLEDMKRVLATYKPRCNIFVSPIFGQIEAADIVQYIKDNKLENCRVQLQLHKYIWHPNQRGV